MPRSRRSSPRNCRKSRGRQPWTRSRQADRRFRRSRENCSSSGPSWMARRHFWQRRKPSGDRETMRSTRRWRSCGRPGRRWRRRNRSWQTAGKSLRMPEQSCLTGRRSLRMPKKNWPMQSGSWRTDSGNLQRKARMRKRISQTESRSWPMPGRHWKIWRCPSGMCWIAIRWKPMWNMDRTQTGSVPLARYFR